MEVSVEAGEAHVPPSSDEDRETYKPTRTSSEGGQKFRPISAPRCYGNLRSKTNQTHDRGLSQHDVLTIDKQYYAKVKTFQHRPTSAPNIREGEEADDEEGSRKLPYIDDWDDDDEGTEENILNDKQDFLFSPQNTEEHESQKGQHLNLSNSIGVKRDGAFHRSASGKHRKSRRKLPQHSPTFESNGALRFIRTPVNSAPPTRIYSPLYGERSEFNSFRPIWALSKPSEEQSLSSSLRHVERERPKIPRRSSSATLIRTIAADPSRPRSSLAPVPLLVVKNPLATKLGKNTGDLEEIGGSFEPLKSQSSLPDYDALHDPHLRRFWSRQDLQHVLKLKGMIRDEYAPDTGLFESAMAKELADLSAQRDIRDMMMEQTAAMKRQRSQRRVSQSAARKLTLEVCEDAHENVEAKIHISKEQPVISAWLSWGKSQGDSAPDLDLSCICFDDKGRVLEIIFYRSLVGKNEALVHLGDDFDRAQDAAVSSDGVLLDHAADVRREETILVELPRIMQSVVAIAFVVTCFSDEGGLADAVGAELILCSGSSRSNPEDELVRHYLSSERYNAALTSMVVRDRSSPSNWSIRTITRVAMANVAVEMVQMVQSLLRNREICSPYTVLIEYCTATRPTSSLRGKKSEFTKAYKAVVKAISHAFPFVRVVGNPQGLVEKPRIGSFEVTLLDGSRVVKLIWSKLMLGRWPQKMDTILRRVASAVKQGSTAAPVPDERSEVEIRMVNASTRERLPWATVEVRALGIAAQKLQMLNGVKKKEKPRGWMADKKGQEEAPARCQYRVQADEDGKLRIRIPGGRYELWGICAGYDCEYPLELLVKPFSKTKMKVTLALALEKRNPV
ncbi:hypothetical protein GUITHDRAFT_118702 [Guillardia theta CCMP2712]|uniref:TerD domain-containing protein n=2 Tax=Guillardia theta TaxID=55529 RepID=L1IGU9_GUITC|nr:hypothetical protein GUITHDRAFT_118702 [Guillardia theta CCMP2712]EKX35154.1 hypothetical protein GUITHDRAFT_118702 [Guillardia theta CCMP2712]|mmetsp:Transcript_37035/g.116517  ORF Transcript_37035/g.116517 Transcript_37035/m.116517 type:complete len:847 (+) Transcript_37035:314-2854(+)|eukprot:XP_005822134.1 hypothetical protein GUITHDRAFT_118702 [Guillardia theta CCMP2712]